MIKDLYRMAIFAKVVECGSFSDAARKLKLGKSVVSQHVQQLEESLRVRLLHRSTRALSLTEEGAEFYRHCANIVEISESAFDNVSGKGGSPRGVIRVTAPQNLGLSFLVDAIHRFRAAFPQIQIHLSLDDAIKNLIDDQFDMAIRVGPLEDSRLFSVKLSGYELVICRGATSPSQHEVREPGDLAHVPWVELPRLSVGNILELRHDNGERATVRVNAVITTNSSIAAQSFVRLGEGHGILPNYAIRHDLTSKQLIRVLPEWHLRQGTISCVFPGKQLSRRVQIFKEFLLAEFREAFGR